MPAACETECRHTLDFRINTRALSQSCRPVEVHASPAELREFAENGYLVRPGLLQGELLAGLRAAMDELTESVLGSGARVGTNRTFGGLFVRHVLDKHRGFEPMLNFPPLLSVARAMLGPLVCVREMVARVTFPDQPNQQTEWHFHQHVVPDPLPAFFPFPHIVDALLYLDELTDATGPLCVVPGSHKCDHLPCPGGDLDDKPNQVKLNVPAGSAVLLHGNLWHRAMPTRPDGTKRRLLIVGYGPTWMKSPPHEEKPNSGYCAELLKNADEETRELLGVAGYM